MSLRVVHCYKSYLPDEIGGVAEAISTITTLRDGIDHTVFVARAFDLPRRYIQANVPVETVPSFGSVLSLPIAPTFPIELRKIARNADLLVLHSPFPLADLALLWPMPKHLAIAVYWHAPLERAKLVGSVIQPLLRHTLRRADRIIAPHPSVIENSATLAAFVEKCVTVPYGVDVEYWSKLTPEEEAAAAILRKRYPRLIVSVGRLVPYKGHQNLLRALRNVDANLILIGIGPLQQQLEKLAVDLGIANRVTIAGWQDRQQIKIMLHAARIFAFPSITPAESFGIAQLEAMAAGLPIVNTMLPTAVPEVARQGLEAITVLPNDSEALSSALKRLLNDDVLTRNFGNAARERATREFNHRTVARQVCEIFQETVQQRMQA